MEKNPNYESAWRKFDNWCRETQVDPIRCDITLILHFISSLFNSGSGYSVIGTQRSAISTFCEPVDGIPISKHPRVCGLVSGVFNQRPLLPRYSFI